jgi:O-antigen/teichoic acid export membrane protein
MGTITMKQTIRGLTPRVLLPYWERLEASPVSYRLARGAFWSVTGALLSRGLGLVAGIIVARILGKAGFGQFGIIRGTIEMVGTFAGFGLGVTTTKYVAELRDKHPERASRILALSGLVAWTTGAVASAVLAMLAPWLAARTLAAPELTTEIRIGALLVMIGAINGAQTGALAGFEAFKRITQVNFWGGMANFPCLTLGSWFFGLKGAVAGLATAQAIGCILNRRALVAEARRARVPLWSSGWSSEFSVIWKFSLPAVMAGALVAPVYWFSQTLLVRQPSGYLGAADFALGAQWRSLAQYLPSLLCAAYLPVAASVHANNPSGRRRLMFGGAAFSAAITAVIGGAVFLFSPWLLAAYGKGFASAKWVLAWMLVTAVIDSINTIFVQTLMASGQAWLRLLSNGLWAALVLGSSLLLVPSYGALGLAMALCAAQSIHLCLQTCLSLYATRQTTIPSKPEEIVAVS